MSGLLLDTNVIIPLLNKRVQHLPTKMRGGLANSSERLVMSVASLWEMAIKVRLGKLDVGSSVDDVPSLAQEIGLELLIINERHAVTAADPEPDTRDPFDRLLLAQCQVEGLLLVTIDRVLAVHPLAWRP